MVTFFKTTFSRILFLLRRAPFLLLLVQLPEVSVDWWDRVFREVFEAKPLIGAITLFPYFIFTTALSSALTALVARAIDEGRTPTLGAALAQLGSRFGSFLKASLLCGVFIVVGMPILIPAIYFMAVYLFVPLFAVFDAPAPAFSLLARSRNLAKPHLNLVIVFTLLSLALGLGFFLIQGELEKLLVDGLHLAPVVGAVSDSLFGFALGVIVNLGAYVIFAALLAKRSVKPENLTQNII